MGDLDGFSKVNTFQVGEVLVLSVAWGTHELDFLESSPSFCFVPQTDRILLYESQFNSELR